MSRWKPRPREVFKLHDKVYWRSKSNGREFLKAGRVISIVAAHENMWDVIEREKFDLTHSRVWKLEDKRYNKPRTYESYLISVDFNESLIRSHRKPGLYWPDVELLKHDTRKPLPRLFLPED